MTEPRAMRVDADDELWRRDEQMTNHDDMSPHTPKFGLPRVLQFEPATAAAQERLAAQEEVRIANQLKQPLLPRCCPVWGEEQSNDFEEYAICAFLFA